MLAIIIKLNLVWVIAAVIILPAIGFMFRLNKKSLEKKRIELLEREMVESHAEILELQEKIANMQAAASSVTDAPVVSLKESSTSKKYPPKDSGNTGGALKSLL
ncbi:hypothetical protein QEG73_12335 [Chitinophagaceae bacterium 26-R-25]|nr:hypothetical protein [Chitinophagaceae bacterium 26-R-25]